MFNTSTTDLNNLSLEELKEISVNELNEYKEARKVLDLTSNIRPIKNLEVLEKRLQAYSLVDAEAFNIRKEINALLDEDVYRKTSNKREVLSNYEVMQNYYDNFR